MKVKELREKITNAGGEIKFRELVITIKEGEDVDIKNTSGNLIGYVSKNQEEESDVENVLSILNVLSNIDRAIEVAQFIGKEVGGIKAVEIEKTIEKVDVESQLKAEKLAGKVEAYENLLIGRDITVAGYKATQN